MRLRKSCTYLLVFLLITSHAFAQSGGDKDSKADAGKKERDEIEKKALALVEGLIKDSQTLKIAENRIRVQLGVAELLWPRAASRAEAVFKDATASLGEIMAGIDGSDPESQTLIQVPAQLRQEMLEVVSRFDLKLSLEFLRATRQPQAPHSDAQSRQPDIEAQLELKLASRIAEKDPAEALRIAEESLKKGIDHELMNLIYRLHGKDKSAAARLTGLALDYVRSEDLAQNYVARDMAFNFLRMGLEARRAAAGPNADQGGESTHIALDERTLKELMAMVISHSLQALSSQGVGALRSLQPMMADVEKYAPSHARPLREKMAELVRMDEAQSGPYSRLNQIAQSGTVDDLLAAAASAPPAIRDGYFEQAAWKAFHQGEVERSVQIINDKFQNPARRREMLLNIDRQVLWRATGQGKLEEVRALIQRIPSMEERASLLAQAASTLTSNNDKEGALALLTEAQLMFAARPANYNHLSAQLQIAKGFAGVDPTRAFAILEPVVDLFNELTEAAVVLDGFELHQYFREGELLLQGGNLLVNTIQQLSTELGSLARQDFDRATSIAERFRRGETRTFARLLIARGALVESEGAEVGSAHRRGHGFSNRRLVLLAR